MKSFVSSLVVVLSFAGTSFGQGPTLESADLVVIGYNTDLDDQFALVALAEIPANSVIFITDEGWDDSDFTFDGAEEVFRWQTPATPLAAGTIVPFTNESTVNLEFSGNQYGILTRVNGNGDLSLAAGDQLFLYQTHDDSYNGVIQRKSGDATESGMIYAFNGDNTMPSTYGWLDPGNAHTSTATQAPDHMTVLTTSDGSGNASAANANGMLTQAALKNGLAANEYDNYRYEGPTTAATKSEWLTRIHTTTNWNANDADTLGVVWQTPWGSSFLVSPSCVEPDTPSISSSATSACNGSSVTLTITGTLNDATAWHVYSGSCGGTTAGSTTTGSISVTLPASAGNTTYYVRGEGGCTSSIACGNVSVNVLEDDDAGFAYAESSYPLSTPNPTPTITGQGGGSFGSNSPGLVVNSSTGEIDLVSSTVGSYTVTYTTAGSCPNTSTAAINVLSAPIPLALTADFVSTESVVPKLYQTEEISLLLDSINRVLSDQGEAAATRWEFIDFEEVPDRRYSRTRLEFMIDSLNSLNQAP